MAILREFRCTAHDHEFESLEESPSCPYGCHPKFVVVEFRTPFAIGTQRGAVMDRLQRDLASDYGMTDMRNDRNGSVMEYTPRESGGARRIGSGRNVREYRPEQTPTWAPSVFRPPQGWAKTGDVPSFDFRQSGLKGPGPVSPTKPQLDVAKTSLRNRTKVEASWRQ